MNVADQREIEIPAHEYLWHPSTSRFVYWGVGESSRTLNLFDLQTQETLTVGEREQSDERISIYSTAKWSMTGDQLAYIGENRSIWLVETTNWLPRQTDMRLPPDAEIYSWTEPFAITTNDLTYLPTPIPFSCTNAPSPRVQVGQTARITFVDGSTTRVRSSPDVLPDNIIANLAEGTELEVVGGPVCSPRPNRSDSYVYWEVFVPSRNLTGWVAEGDFNDYYLEPWP